MRLRQIAQEIHSTIGLLAPELTSLGGNNAKVTNFKPAIEAARRLRDAEILKPFATRVLNLEELQLGVLGEVALPRETAQQFVEAVASLRSHAQLLADAIETILPRETSDMVAVRLPPISDLQTLADQLSNLERILSQAIVNPYVDGEVRLVGFDQGSNWVELSLKTAKAVLLIGGLLTAIQQVQLNQAQVDAQWQAVRTATLRNDALESAVRALDENLKGLASQELEERIEALAKECGVPDDDHEYRQRLKMVTKELSGMIERGLEIHPALALPPEARAVFPVPEELTAAVRQLVGPSHSSGSAPAGE